MYEQNTFNRLLEKEPKARQTKRNKTKRQEEDETVFTSQFYDSNIWIAKSNTNGILCGNKM
jgi:hypothetical protein